MYEAEPLYVACTSTGELTVAPLLGLVIVTVCDPLPTVMFTVLA
jgi:hypothetical protein